jgi:hypothetical protein
VVAAVFAGVLIAFSSRYGYHRDELYFIAIGGHPAFGYVDQPPLVPLLAHAMDVLGGHHLWIFRLPSALAGAAIVLLTGMIAREFDAGRRAQLVAAVSVAVSGVLIGVSHLMSTTTYDMLLWTVISYLVIRGIKRDGPVWVVAGLAAGVALEVKTLPAFFLFALLVGLVLVGPRHVLGSRWLWTGAVLALLIWLPNLWWQAVHDWPQFKLAKAIAAGHSGSSTSRAAFVPTLLLQFGPPLVPFWIAGLVRLARERAWRFFAVAYVVLLVIFLVTAGKPYYLAGLYPVLFAAGAEPMLRWLRVAVVLIVAEALVTPLIVLPIVPVGTLHDTPIVAMNYDAGETVGWPRFADQVGDAARSAHAVVITQNYGEAGALLHYRPDVDGVYGAQNSMWDLGTPHGDRAVAVGFDITDLAPWFGSVRRIAKIDNGEHVDNDEQGGPVYLCVGPITSWRTIWPKLRALS